MSDIYKWEYYKYKRYFARVKNNITGSYFEHYAGRKMLSPVEGNQKICELLLQGKPCAISRFGLTEMSVIANREALKIGKKERFTDENLCTLSGFFPNEKKLIDQFAVTIVQSIHDIDILGVWYNRAEEYIVDKYMKDTLITDITAIEPYIFENPWSACLEGRKVLVIHPFADSITQQYKIHDKLFKNKKVLPDFQISTIKAVQTLTTNVDERFSNWFVALDYMEKQMDEIDYDVAIIGCGAYGMPLALHAKKMGKQAIHMGGATQILFGIKGKRWDDNNVISSFYNEYWIRPNQKEQIKRQDTVENGCYW